MCLVVGGLRLVALVVAVRRLTDVVCCVLLVACCLLLVMCCVFVNDWLLVCGCSLLHVVVVCC